MNRTAKSRNIVAFIVLGAMLGLSVLIVVQRTHVIVQRITIKR